MGENRVLPRHPGARTAAHRRHGLTGCSRCGSTGSRTPPHLRRRPTMRMSDLAIPIDVVIAGVRKRRSSPAVEVPPSRSSPPCGYDPPVSPIGIGPLVGARMWQVAAFIDMRVVKPIVVAPDHPTRDLNVVDAASLSAAIPGVLHHETTDPTMIPILDALLQTKTARRSSTAVRPATSPSNWRGSGYATAGSAPVTRAIWRSTASTRSGIRGTSGWSRSPRRSGCRRCATCPTPTISCDSGRHCHR